MAYFGGVKPKHTFRSPHLETVWALHRANPDWPTVAIHAAMVKDGKRVKYATIRGLVVKHNIPVPIAIPSKNVDWYNTPKEPEPEVVKPVFHLQPGSYSYQGRSRLQPGYVEL